MAEFGKTGIAEAMAEERLLRARFGAEYDAFVRRVPALLPKITWR